jgi:hypothetical protein
MANEHLLPYPGQRAICRGYEALGHSVDLSVTNRGNRRVTLDGGRKLCIADAMSRIEAALTIHNAWHLAA